MNEYNVHNREVFDFVCILPTSEGWWIFLSKTGRAYHTYGTLMSSDPLRSTLHGDSCRTRGVRTGTCSFLACGKFKREAKQSGPRRHAAPSPFIWQRQAMERSTALLPMYVQYVRGYEDTARRVCATRS